MPWGRIVCYTWPATLSLFGVSFTVVFYLSSDIPTVYSCSFMSTWVHSSHAISPVLNDISNTVSTLVATFKSDSTWVPEGSLAYRFLELFHRPRRKAPSLLLQVAVSASHPLHRQMPECSSETERIRRGEMGHRRRSWVTLIVWYINASDVITDRFNLHSTLKCLYENEAQRTRLKWTLLLPSSTDQRR